MSFNNSLNSKFIKSKKVSWHNFHIKSLINKIRSLSDLEKTSLKNTWNLKIRLYKSVYETIKSQENKRFKKKNENNFHTNYNSFINSINKRITDWFKINK